MTRVTVTLRAGYLARHVTLRVGKRPFSRRVWEIQAADGAGFYTIDIRVNGEPAPTFKTRREAVAYLDSLALAPDARIWATPDEARPVPPVIPTSAIRGRYGFALGGAVFMGARS